MKTDVLIIGGGLTGLALAEILHRKGVDFHLFEARDRFGGRIDVLHTPTGNVDLGPSWFWSGQPRIAKLIDSLGLHSFLQYAKGELSFEDESGQVQRGVGFASMEGSFRIEGGMTALIDGLVDRLPAERLHLDCAVTSIDSEGRVDLKTGNICLAQQVVLAVPPRVAARLHFTPVLTADVIRALEMIPTWMAGHAKFIAVYERPFWRDLNLSGDAMSRRGPLAEIHDACGAGGTPAALFGFLGVPAAQRVERSDEITNIVLLQLSRFFGAQAACPTETFFKDWAFEPQTATDQDHQFLNRHPEYGLPQSLSKIWSGKLHFASTETAPEMGGLMEGALASAERVANQILASII